MHEKTDDKATPLPSEQNNGQENQNVKPTRGTGSPGRIHFGEYFRQGNSWTTGGGRKVGGYSSSDYD